MNSNELKEYRTKLYTDLFSNTIPDRIPVQDAFGTVEYLIQYAGKDLMLTQYSYTDELLEEIYFKAGEELLRGDKFVSAYARNAIGIMFEQSLSNQMGSSGFIQHTENCFMQPDEYVEYIENPFDFFIEKVSPRECKQLSKDGAFRSRAVLLRQLAAMDQIAMFGRITAKMVEKYGFSTEPAGSGTNTQPPFDMIADFARGFSQIPMDMRRCPEKLKDAMAATMPLLLAMGTPSKPHVLGSAKIMTHMPAFLSLKQYEEFYHPTFAEMHHIYAEKGWAMQNFLEGDWTRFIDDLSELPMGTRIYMEKGDMKKFKDALGKKLVLGGFYPISMLRSGTKQQCIDLAKEILDVMAPGGNYFFCFDKSALSPEDLIPENYIAVLEYIRDNSKYQNAGEAVSEIKKEDTIIKGLASKYPEFKSKYLPSFEEYIKEYPPVDQKAVPYMKAAYEKYMSKLGLGRNY